MNKYLLIACAFLCNPLTAQVNLQTGAAEANFQLFNYEDPGNRLSTSIELQYMYGNGLKLNEFPGNVGVGWNLLAGGVISRLQFGEPDDQVVYEPLLVDNVATVVLPNGLLHQDYPDMNYPGGYMYSTKSPQSNIPAVAALNPYFGSGYGRKYKILIDDREQDRYVFQFNGRRGIFVIGKDKVPVILDDSKLRVSFVETDMTASRVRTRISAFTITDEQGIQYKFNALEFTEVLKYGAITDATTNYTVYKGEPYTSNQIINQVVTKWFLTEIRNPMSNEVITFNYDDFAIDVQGPYATSHQFTNTSDGAKTSSIALARRVKASSKRLMSIQMPGARKVVFNYSAADRVDFTGDKALNSIVVYNNNKQVYGYQFDYGYMYRKSVVPLNYDFGTGNEKRYVRLCLKSLRKTGTDNSLFPPYVFSYHLPPNTSLYEEDPPLFTIFSDHFGYFSSEIHGVSETDAGVPTSASPKSIGYSIQWPHFGILKSIQYPEGGNLEFQYEFNTDEASIYPNKYAGGVRVAKTILYDGEDHARDIVKRYKYIKEDGTSSGWGFEQAVYTEVKGIRQVKASGTVSSGLATNQLATNFITQLLWNRASGITMGTLGGGFLPGSGAAAFQTIIVYIIGQLIDILFSDPYKDLSTTIYRSDNICLSNPLPLQYARVEVEDEIYTNGTLTGTNGKVVHEFTSPDFYPLRVPATFSPPYSAAKQRYAHWLYGLPLRTTWFNAAGQTVRKTENEYNPIVREIANNNNISRSYWVNRMVVTAYQRANVYNDISTDFLTSEAYYPIQGRAELTRTIETMYNASGESTASEASFTYSPNNFAIRTITKQDSKGDASGSTTYYAADYQVPGTIEAMKSANYLNVPLSVNTWKRNAGETGNKLTNAVVTEYMKTGNGDFKPTQVYLSRLNSPLSASIADVANFSPGNLINYSYLKPASAIRYSGETPVEYISTDGGTVRSNIYDYNNKLIVAQVENAKANEIRYTSFEAEGTGGWQLSSNGAILSNGFFRTGSKCYNLDWGSISTTLDMDNKPIVISAWATGSQLTIAVPGTVQPSRTGPTINGWTYYEFELVDIGQITTITVNGNGYIDELRLYPARARMATYTYEPGIGITSETDPNNRTLYHKYDAFGREIEVRDEYLNLIKAYQYNFKH